MKNVFLRLQNSEQAGRFISNISRKPNEFNLEHIKEQAIEVLDDPNTSETVKSYAKTFANAFKKLVEQNVTHIPLEGKEKAKLVRNGREIKF